MQLTNNIRIPATNHCKRNCEFQCIVNCMLQTVGVDIYIR